MNRLALCALTAATLFAFSLPAAAQPVPSATPGLGGNAIPGVCLLSREAIFANAKVGLAVSARLKTLAEQAQAEVDAERKPIDVEIQALQAGAARLTPEQRSTREQALAPRLQAVQAKAQQRSREIEATRGKAMARIAAETQPVIAAAYTAKKCGLLLDRTAVLGGNLGNDLTPAVVQGLDAKITTLTFERETLQAPSGQ